MALDLKTFSSGLNSFGSAASAFGSAAVAGASAAAEDLLAKGSRLQGQANTEESKAYGQSAEIAKKNRDLSVTNTNLQLGANQEQINVNRGQLAANKIQAMQEKRQQFLAAGSAKADIAAAGLSAAGSGAEVLRDSARQGEIVQQLFHLQGGAISIQGDILNTQSDVIRTQGAVDLNSIDQQILAYQTQEKSADFASQEAEISAQAHEANAAGLRSSKGASTAGGILGAIGGIASIFSLFCWIAREVYGASNPRWVEFREWMYRDSPLWLFNWYMENGEAVATWLHAHPRFKPPVRWLMDAILLMARRPAEVANA